MNLLASLSAAQLVPHLLGASTAIRLRIPVDNIVYKGEPDTVTRDMWWMGSGMAGPWPGIALQGALTVALFRRDRVWLRRTLGGIGVLYVAGYLSERVVRESLRRPNELTLLVGSSIALSAAMALVGLTAKR